MCSKNDNHSLATRGNVSIVPGGSLQKNYRSIAPLPVVSRLKGFDLASVGFVRLSSAQSEKMHFTVTVVADHEQG